MAHPTVLSRPVAHSDRPLTTRFAESARATDSTQMPNDVFRSWFNQQRLANRFEVNRIRLDQLRGWREHPATGNLAHDSGRFFAIEGLSVRTDWPHGGTWMQPIINQPEIGVLGIVVKEFDGVLHFLMQAKMEPGNIGTVQLSPTVQATRSNYVGVHHGRSIIYLDYFIEPTHSRVLVDVLQSEQGSWFLHKRNRNMIVEVEEDIEPHPDFCWLTLGQLQGLLREDNLINMDARSVLSCVPLSPDPAQRGHDEYTDALLRSLRPGQRTLHSDAEVLSWLTDIKARHELVQRLVPLKVTQGWHRTDDAIRHDEGKFFEVVAVEVQAENREVQAWTQPLFEPIGEGIAAFFARPIDGVMHLLVHAKMEAGVHDVAELAPTFQARPANFSGVPEDARPRFEREVLSAPTSSLRYDGLQSEEGGRFHFAANRYRIVDVGTDFPLDQPPEYRWVTPRQLMSLLVHSYYVNVQARSLLACLQATW